MKLVVVRVIEKDFLDVTRRQNELYKTGRGVITISENPKES